MNFDIFEKVENTIVRKGGYTVVREQSYDFLKFRKAVKKSKNEDGTEKEEVEGRFFVANAAFKIYALDTNGLVLFSSPDGKIVLAVVAEADAEVLKKVKRSKANKKVRNFKYLKMEAALDRLGIIKADQIGETQIVDGKLIATNVTIKGVACSNVFELSKGVQKVEEKVEETKATEEPALVKAAQPQAEPQAEAKADDWG